jgi:ribosomal protein S18 acetylase RimI-like enzyme
LARTSARVARVEQKLAEATAYLVVVCDDEGVVGMALAEPYRAEDGSGPVMVGRGHVSMVFVAPERWGSGIGCELLDALHLTMREHGYSSASLWTRVSNERARRLYEGRGYERTTDVKRLPGGDTIVRYEIALGASPGAVDGSPSWSV